MEALLVNKCAYNKENLTEMVKATRKFATTVLLVCVVILILLSGVYAFYLYDLLMAGLTLFFAALFGVYEVLVPTAGVKKVLKRYQELYHTEVESELFFCEDSILNTSPQTKGESTIIYSQIKKVLRTKNLYIIRIGAQLVLIVHKDGFSKGGCADFEVLMRQKATQAKIKY